jgi:hypothetical protein
MPRSRKQLVAASTTSQQLQKQSKPKNQQATQRPRRCCARKVSPQQQLHKEKTKTPRKPKKNRTNQHNTIIETKG